jgi:hypothetical protein
MERPEGGDLARMGLDPPVLGLELETGDEEGIVVAFGGTDGAGAVYVKRSDLEAVMTVPGEAVEKLAAAHARADELRDGRVAPIDRFELSSIAISGEGGTMALVKDEKSVWRLGGADGAEIPAERVDSLLDAVEALKATAFLDEAAADPPVLTLTFEGGKEDRKVTEIRLLPDRGDEHADRRMLSTASSAVYVVPALSATTLLDRVAAVDSVGEEGGNGVEGAD